MTCVEYAGRLADRPIDYYNNVLLHSAVGYVTSRDMLEGHAPAIQEERKRKFKAAREKRRFANREMKTNSTMRRETEEGYAGGQPSRNGDATERR